MVCFRNTEMSMDAIQYGNIISPEEYLELKKAVKWKLPSLRQIEAGLSNNVFVVVARSSGKCVGMTRLVGDGGYFYLFVDVIVHPEFQGRQIGKTMVSMALDFIKSQLREGETASVNLMAAKEKESFYKKFGFEERPHATQGAGMTMHLSRE